MSLGMDQQPYDKQTARQTNSQTEVRGRDTRTDEWNDGGASRRRVGHWGDIRLLILRRLAE